MLQIAIYLLLTMMQCVHGTLLMQYLTSLAKMHPVMTLLDRVIFILKFPHILLVVAVASSFTTRFSKSGNRFAQTGSIAPLRDKDMTSMAFIGAIDVRRAD